MRRMLLAPALTGLLLLTACGTSGNQTPQTVTVLNTVTGGASTTAATAPGQSIVVGSSGEATTPEASESESSAVSSESAPSSPSGSPEATGVPQAGVDPLAVACDGILDAGDIKQSLGADLRAGVLKRPDVADPARDVTGRTRCRFGSEDEGKTSQITVLLTTYGSPASAATQVETTATVERNESAVVSEIVVNGFPGYLMLRQGGLIVVQYGSWTMTIAVQDQFATEEALTTGLPELAGIVLNRIVANG